MMNIELIEGLEILSINNNSIPIPICIFLCVLCIGIILVNIYFFVSALIERDFGVVIIAAAFIGMYIFLSSIIITNTITPIPIYKVLVSDSVSMNEFYDKYEILNVEGKIYTIKPKGE